jgi:DNA-binding MarR family transcriptional regulator
MAQQLIPAKQIEMPLQPGRLALTKSQVACLGTVRRGIHSKTQVAIATHLDLRKTLRALDALAKLDLITKTADHHWRVTRRGRACRFRTIPDKARRGSSGLGHAALRLLQALNRPMGGSELANELGVTKQRVHQLVVALHGTGHVRLGDPDRVLHIIAHKDDPTSLLSRSERRVFAAITDQYDTTAAKIRLAVGCSDDEAAETLRRLVGMGLVAENKKVNGSRHYQVTKVGSLHPQYRQSAQRASPPPLPVRSDRVLAVLSLLAEHGRAQITEVRDALGVAHQTINALFQYLKRKSLVCKEGKALRSPYLLTDQGREALAALRCRRSVSARTGSGSDRR